MLISRKIFTALQTDVKVHPSFLILLAIIFIPVIDQSGEEILRRLIFTFGLVLCVTLHEFGHIFMARRLGYRTGDIILNMLGGLAHVEFAKQSPKSDILVAAAGPLVNLVLGLSAALLYFILRPAGDSLLEYSLMAFTAINAIMMLFNLLPIFPLDGGRILRGFLTLIFGSDKGARISLVAGVVLCLPLLGYALWNAYIILTGICLLILLFSFYDWRQLSNEKVARAGVDQPIA